MAQTVRRLGAGVRPVIGDMQLDGVLPGDAPAIVEARAGTAVAAEDIGAIVQQIRTHAIRSLLVTANPSQP